MTRTTGKSGSLRVAAAVALIALLATTLRLVFPTADPPWNPSVGVVWHDEGAWVHNARNRALHGSWFVENDAWNPLFIAPVFTGLEYLSFAAFGVGVRQARLVSELAGLASVLLLALGVRRAAGAPAGLIAGGLLATNYVYVMYNRAAIMEATMVAWMVAAWYCYVRAQDRPFWGGIAAVCALMAFFTKAAAAFFVAAIAIDAVFAVVRPALNTRYLRDRRPIPSSSARNAAPASRPSSAWRPPGSPRSPCSWDRTGRATGSTTGR